MDAKLVVIGGKANMGEVKLRLPMTIGRGSKADLIISHPTVSREHCKLTEIKGELLVTDNNSSNGVFVDGEKIEKPTIVRSGQILAIGPLTFRAEYETKSKKPKAPAPDKSGLAETQAVDRDEFDIDFIMDDSPSAQTQAAVPKKKPEAAKTESKTLDNKSTETTKKAKPEAKAPAAPKQPAPAKDAPKGKSPAAPRVGETDEMDLDFLLDDVAEEKKKSPAGRDTDQIDIEDLDLIAGDEKPKAPAGDDLTTDFRDEKSAKVAAEKTVSFQADELDLGDDFFTEEKTEEPAAPTKAQAPAAPETKSTKTDKPAAKEPPKKEQEPVAKKAPTPAPEKSAPEKPATPSAKKGGVPDFDFLSAGPAAAPKEDVALGDFAAQFDFTPKAKKSEAPPVETPSEKRAEEPVVDEAAVAEAPVAKTPAAADDEAMFDDFLADLGNDVPAAEAVAKAPTAEEPAVEMPVVEEEAVVEDLAIEELVVEAPAVEEPPAEVSAADEFALDELLAEELPLTEEPKAVEAAAAPAVDEDELPFSEPIAPPAASELPAMPELAETKAPVFDDELFGLDEPAATETPVLPEPAFHEAADAAAVAPAEKAESFSFDEPPAEVPVFDAASEKMTLEEAIAAETPATHESIAPEQPVAEAKADDAMDFDFLSDLDPPAVEAAPEAKVEETWPAAAEKPAAEQPADGLADISLDLDEVPAGPPTPEFDLSAMNETQDIDLRAAAEENPLAASLVEMEVSTDDEAPAKAESTEFDFLEPEAPAAKESSPFDFSALETKQPSATADQTIAFTAPAEEAPVAQAPAQEAAAADDFDFLADESPAPQAAAPDLAPTADAAPGGFEIDVAAKGDDKTEAFDFGMFGEADTKPAASEEKAADEMPEFGISAESELAVGPSAKPSAAAPSEPVSGAMNFEAASSVPMMPMAPAAKAKPAAAPKLSLFDKIKMLFGGGKAKPAKGKSAKSKTTQGLSDAPVAKLPPMAPPKPSLDPIPLDDGPAPTFDFDAPAAEKTPAARPAFDAGPTISLDAPPAESSAAGPNFSGVPSGWKPTDAPIPLDDDPISLFDEPATPTDAVAPPASEAAAAPAAPAAEETAPWDDISVSSTPDVSESNAPFTLGDVEAARPEAGDESAPGSTVDFDIFADDSVMDASANPEAQALSLLAAQEAAAASATPTVEAAPEKTEEQPAASPVAEAPATEPAATEAPAVDDWMAALDVAPAAEAAPPVEAKQEHELEVLGLVDDVALADAAPTDSTAAKSDAPAAEEASELDSWLEGIAPANEAPAASTEPSPPASDVDDFKLASEPAAAADSTSPDATMAWTAASETPANQTPASESPAADAADSWSFDEFADAPQADSSTLAASTEARAELEPTEQKPDVAASPAAEAAPPAPAPIAPAPPVSNRRRPVDVDLRISSSMLSLTRLSVRPPRMDIAEMEPDTPSGRSFEPRAKTPAPAAPAAAPASESASAPAAETPAAAEGAGFSFDDWNTPTPPAAAPQAAAAEAAEEFSFLDDLTATETPSTPAADAAESPSTDAPAATDDADRTMAYLGSPKVVEEAESFLASLDESAAAAPEPAFDLDAMLAESSDVKPTAAASPAAESAADAPVEDELSFLSLSDEVVESEPVAEVPAPVKPDEAAHAPSADADFGFLDLMEEKEAQVDELADFRFDEPPSGAKEPAKAEGAKIEPPKSESDKNGAKPTPQPAAASPAADAELDDFLRDLGMN